MSEADWSALSATVSVGDLLRARVVRVDRWGALLELRLPFPGFMDRLNIDETTLGSLEVGDDLEVVVVQWAEYNRQVRVRLP